MAKHEITAEASDAGFRFELIRSAVFGMKRAPVAFDNWQPEMHPAVGLLKLLAANDVASERDGMVWVENDTIACISPAETALLALPPACPYALHLAAVGAVSDPAFKVRLIWLDKTGVDVIGLRRTGAELTSAADRFLLSEPLDSVVGEAEALNALPVVTGREGLDAQLIRFARFKQALGHATGDAGADKYLSGITIHHATGLAITPLAADTDIVTPVLYGDALPPPAPRPTRRSSQSSAARCWPQSMPASSAACCFPTRADAVTTGWPMASTWSPMRRSPPHWR
jgi:hypothetical protein